MLKKNRERDKKKWKKDALSLPFSFLLKTPSFCNFLVSKKHTLKSRKKGIFTTTTHILITPSLKKPTTPNPHKEA